MAIPNNSLTVNLRWRWKGHVCAKDEGVRGRGVGRVRSALHESGIQYYIWTKIGLATLIREGRVAWPCSTLNRLQRWTRLRWYSLSSNPSCKVAWSSDSGAPFPTQLQPAMAIVFYVSRLIPALQTQQLHLRHDTSNRKEGPYLRAYDGLDWYCSVCMKGINGGAVSSKTDERKSEAGV